ncbi:MAG: alpha/beta hydrolase [Clostridia bacterium]|nr:alpha/beta hydrolase [Clostridia bacterium]
MLFLWIALGIAGLALFLCAALMLVIYYTAFYNPPKRRLKDYYYLAGEQYEPVQQAIFGIVDGIVNEKNFEEVSITARDGIKLVGKYYPFFDEDAPLEIIFHGYRSAAERDCGGGFALAKKRGHNVLLPDQRAHGKSGGRCLTFGIKERYDCLAWCRWAAERFPQAKIVISGVSMGAATVLMASDLPLPDAVKGIMADSGYSSPKAVCSEVTHSMGLPPKPIYPFTKLTARLFAGVDLEESSAVEAVAHAKVPILLVHGEEDHFVPFYMCGEIENAIVGEKTVLTVPGAPHAVAYLVDKETYTRVTDAFCERVLAD